jgi:hypothetical protein
VGDGRAWRRAAEQGGGPGGAPSGGLMASDVHRSRLEGARRRLGTSSRTSDAARRWPGWGIGRWLEGPGGGGDYRRRWRLAEAEEAMVATGFGFQIRSGDAREKRIGKTNLAILLYQPLSYIHR